MRFPLDRDENTSDILRFILRGHMLDIREVARFPAICTVLSSEGPFAISDHSSTCIRLVRELLDNAVDRVKANWEGWYHRHQGTWLMARSAGRSALHLVGVALKCRQAAVTNLSDLRGLESQLLPSDWKEAVESVIELMDYWADESVDMKRFGTILKELLRCYGGL